MEKTHKIDNNDESDIPKKKQKLESTPKSEESLPESNEKQSNNKEVESMIATFTKSGSGIATKRLIKDFKTISALNPSTVGFDAIPVKDNLYHWKVNFFGFEENSNLAKDLIEYGKKYGETQVQLEVRFANDYPFSAPFIRVIKPRFKFHTGHVTVGGSICMELLTNSGWTPTHSLESVLIQVRSEMIAGDARIDLNSSLEYSLFEAAEAFERVARQHGWHRRK